jgi:hypothetical protein
MDNALENEVAPADAALLRQVADDYMEEAARYYAGSQASGVHGSDGARLTHKAARLRALADTLD